MNTSGEAAEQIVRMSLEGFEVAARITAAGAKNIVVLLYSILKDTVRKQFEVLEKRELNNIYQELSNDTILYKSINGNWFIRLTYYN